MYNLGTLNPQMGALEEQHHFLLYFIDKSLSPHWGVGGFLISSHPVLRRQPTDFRTSEIQSVNQAASD